MPSVASHGVNNLPASCTSLLSAWASQGITIPQCLSWTHLTRFVTLAEFLPTSGHSCIFPKNLQCWYFPWGMLENTHKAFTFMVIQQSEGPELELPILKPTKTLQFLDVESIPWQCFQTSVYQLIVSNKSKESQAKPPATHCHTGWGHRNKRGSTARLKRRRKPQTLICGWHGMKNVV